jgi:Rrf2 family protein
MRHPRPAVLGGAYTGKITGVWRCKSLHRGVGSLPRCQSPRRFQLDFSLKHKVQNECLRAAKSFILIIYTDMIEYCLCGTAWKLMKISQKGLYALQALMVLARRYRQGAIRIRDIAYEENLPEKFLELILLELKNARMVESVRGAKGGYQLKRPPNQIFLSEVIRTIDGPLAPFADGAGLQQLIDSDKPHRQLYSVFMEVRNAAAQILENTSLANIAGDVVGHEMEKKKHRGRQTAEH